MARTARIERNTAETQIELELDLDGSGQSQVATGVGFFDHMLTLWAKHGAVDLKVRAIGDLHVDQHHTVEDVGIVLGQAVRTAVGDKAGIRRYGHFTLPMDETLATTAIDLGGRPCLVFRAELPAPKSAISRPNSSTSSGRPSPPMLCATCTSLCTTAATATTSPRRSSSPRRAPAHGTGARRAPLRRAEHQGNALTQSALFMNVERPRARRIAAVSVGIGVNGEPWLRRHPSFPRPNHFNPERAKKLPRPSAGVRHASPRKSIVTVYEHAMLGIDAALAAGLYRRAGWQIVAWAGCAAALPDWDGLSLLFGAQAYDAGHRLWGHNFLVAGLVGTVVGACVYRMRALDRMARRLGTVSLAHSAAGRRRCVLRSGARRVGRGGSACLL